MRRWVPRPTSTSERRAMQAHRWQELRPVALLRRTALPEAAAERARAATSAPKWFSRARGWDGRTRAEAVAFCRDARGVGGAGTLCPYSALCPAGPRSPPLIKVTKPLESWVPVADLANGWVRVDSAAGGEMCATVTETEKSGAIEEYTRHVACCRATATVVESREQFVGPAEGGDELQKETGTLDVRASMFKTSKEKGDLEDVRHSNGTTPGTR